MPEKVSQGSEYETAHHNKAEHAIYTLVPTILGVILDDIPSIEGFAIGGSYANGKYADGDDVDLDILFDSYPVNFDQQILIRELKQRFAKKGLVVEVRAPLAKSTLPESMRKGLYASHPNTPFVVRNEQVAEDWGFIIDSNSNKGN